VKDLDTWRLAMLKDFLDKKVSVLEVKDDTGTMFFNYTLGERAAYKSILAYLDGLMEEES